MPKQITAKHEPALTARIVRRIPLLYDDDPNPNVERLPYVRAGSSLTCFHEYMAVVQDNANFLALINLSTGRARSLALPAGSHGDRIFDHDHANTEQKFDLEACVSIPGDREMLLVAFGSGSQSERERIVVIRWPDAGKPEATAFHGAAFYAALRSQHDFSGSELNVEGAIYLGDDRVRLFERGNGAPHDGLEPVDATGDLSWSALWAHLQDPTQPPPQLDNIMQYQLGTLDDQPLNFSDAEAVGDVILYSASAEGSDGAGKDGAIGGSVLGVINPDGARWTRLTTEDSSNFKEKIEGLSIGLGNRYHAYFVVDDDKDEPSSLFEVELSGPWYTKSMA
jgi:hypothetical protein